MENQQSTTNLDKQKSKECDLQIEKTKKGEKNRKRLKEKMKKMIKLESVCKQFLGEIKYFRFAFLEDVEVSKTVFNI